MQLNGGQALIKSLEMEGVEVIFGLPGGAILPVYDPIIDSPIRHILVRHEQGAGHMAEGYAHATGRPGVAMVTSGPGATNIVTPLCDAFMDSIPMVVITGQVPVPAIGSDAFQECDTTGITMSVTKHNFLVTKAEDIPRTIRGMSWASVMSQLCLVTGIVMPTVSHSWNASVPIRWVGTWPVSTTSGIESISASTIAVTVLVAPGPEVTSTTPGLPVDRA